MDGLPQRDCPQVRMAVPQLDERYPAVHAAEVRRRREMLSEVAVLENDEWLG
jgi:hypothetical protein